MSTTLRFSVYMAGMVVIVAILFALFGMPGLTAYLLAASIVVLVSFAYDKQSAITSSKRIPEAAIPLICLIGGTPGGLIGMSIFRHKTKDTQFKMLFMVIIGLQALIMGALFLRG